jgi:hypothetical protein
MARESPTDTGSERRKRIALIGVTLAAVALVTADDLGRRYVARGPWVPTRRWNIPSHQHGFMSLGATQFVR